MKKILASLILLCGFAMADSRIRGASTYQVLGRGLTWTSTVNNNFILDTISPSTGMCVNIQNNDTLSHTYTLNAFETSDLQVITYTGVTGKWNPIPVSPGTAGNTAASSTDQYWINTAGAAHVVIAIAGGSGAGTADITIAQTGSFCGGGVTTAGCSLSKTAQVATAGTSTVIPTPGAGLFIHVCAYQTSGQVTTTAALTFTNGSSGACAVLGATIWLINAATGNSTAQLAVTAPSQLFQTTVSNQPLCVNNAGTGSNQAVSVSYAIF